MSITARKVYQTPDLRMWARRCTPVSMLRFKRPSYWKRYLETAVSFDLSNASYITHMDALTSKRKRIRLGLHKRQ